MSSLSIFVFDNADNFVIRRDLTSSELAAKSATFSLPKSLASTPCSFYAVANYDASSAKTRAALTALVEKSAGDYNGTFADVSTKALRSGGFVMSGSTTKTVGAVNSTTNVGITLKRTVAKIALQTTIDPSFADKYAGTLTINSVKLSKAASQSLVVAGTPTPGAMTFSHTQTPATASGKMNSLFYIFENGSLAEGSRVLLEIEATYDSDGSTSTTDDRSEVVYSIELTGKAAGSSCTVTRPPQRCASNAYPAITECVSRPTWAAIWVKIPHRTISPCRMPTSTMCFRCPMKAMLR